MRYVVSYDQLSLSIKQIVSLAQSTNHIVVTILRDSLLVCVIALLSIVWKRSTAENQMHEIFHTGEELITSYFMQWMVWMHFM